jgi:hydroxyacylglutathione hydrolase
LLTITHIDAFTDNYIWAIVQNKECIIVDPGDAKPVIQFLNKKKLKLKAILITHHHHDHTAGVKALMDKYHPEIYGPKMKEITKFTQELKEGDTVDFPEFNLKFDVIEIPGHTLDQIAYYCAPYLFSGDTLFSAGCGRIFEGTPEQMLNSLNRLKSLPDDTQIYCAHEYTLSNLNFATLIEPSNQAIKKHMKHCRQLRDKKEPTLPTLMKDEKLINPFLRCDRDSVKQRAEYYLNKALGTEEEVFTAIRKWKNHF